MNTPSAQPASPALDLPAMAVPARLLGDGEVVILAIKPSPWFVVLVSWQVLIVAILVPLLLYLGVVVFEIRTAFAPAAVFWICAGAALVRLFVACLQWAGRLYVLTNLRLMRVRGMAAHQVAHCPLKDIRKVVPSAMMTERLLGLGSLSFETARGDSGALTWLHVDRLEDVRAVITEAIRRIK